MALIFSPAAKFGALEGIRAVRALAASQCEAGGTADHGKLNCEIWVISMTDLVMKLADGAAAPGIPSRRWPLRGQ